MDIDNKFWEGKKVFCTGSTGFVGGHLVKRLLSLKADVKQFVHHHHPEDKKTVGYVGDLTCWTEHYKKYLLEFNPEIIFHLAAQPIVGIAMEKELDTLDINIKGTYNFFHVCKELPDVKVIIHVACYDEKTRGLTTEGLKYYNEMKIGDKVLSINPETREIEETDVLEVIELDYDGEMISFNTKSTDLLVTPNHRMLIENKPMEFVRADSSIPSTGWKKPYGVWKGKDYSIPELVPLHWNHKKLKDNLDINSLLYLLGIFIGDGCIEHQVKTVKSKTGLSAREFVSTRRDGTTGRFISRNAPNTNFTMTNTTNVIYLYIPHNDPCRKVVEESLTTLGIEFHDWIHSGEGALYFSSKEICELFSETDVHSYEKQIPKWALKFPPENLVYLLKGIMDSDGDKATKTHLTTTSSRLVENIIELGIKCNYDVLFKEKTQHGSFINGREIKQKHTAYTVTISKQNKRIMKSNRKVVDYKGKIWCLKLRENKNFIVERNGKVMFCGNTDKVFGSVEEIKDDSPLLGVEHPYNASKLCGDILAQMYANSFDLPITIIRNGNVYGPHDLHWDRIVPGTIKRVVEDERPIVRGNALRDYIHVDDIVNGYLMAAQFRYGKQGLETFNFGSSKPYHTKEVVDLILQYMNCIDVRPEYQEMWKGELKNQHILEGKAQELLGWKPEISLEDGLKSTVAWYVQYLYHLYYLKGK